MMQGAFAWASQTEVCGQHPSHHQVSNCQGDNFEWKQRLNDFDHFPQAPPSLTDTKGFEQYDTLFMQLSDDRRTVNAFELQVNFNHDPSQLHLLFILNQLVVFILNNIPKIFFNGCDHFKGPWFIFFYNNHLCSDDLVIPLDYIHHNYGYRNSWRLASLTTTSRVAPA